MALLFLAVLIGKLMFDSLMVIRAEILADIYNPVRRCRDVVIQKESEV